MSIRLKAKVVGVRIYTNQGRHITLEWQDQQDGDLQNAYPIHHTIEVKDGFKQFDLGDEVNIEMHPTAIGVEN
jgi:hypothetical protein